MQYTKPMIELVFEIRRRVPADLKPSVKLANPELLDELVTHHRHSKDVICQTLIKELLQLAGDPWNHALSDAQQDAEEAEAAARPRQVTKVYRGQVTLEEAPPKDNASTPRERTKRMYRGQEVID
ncbi:MULTISPECIES: hypothetical protein [unclassified Marinimicrobium]|jgi:hypothetical protein|uniref:hypothetical protein n=1 Tax=unclassified Marinimicrobium TaxID=2632100 RepID=UPI000C6068B1|nr:MULTISPECIES: hypothetical protein [unclassified Marinimicrobium]MAN50603.1 hypothetical protein [Marinimicrobium sp.]|tara:strand:- start:379 stop:753 length:375 start_codon:yes stop_codon:yes gene_type:complete